MNSISRRELIRRGGAAAATTFTIVAPQAVRGSLAEGVHSLADTGNQLLLLRGGAKSKKDADQQHPFGYGRERYVYAFAKDPTL